MRLHHAVPAALGALAALAVLAPGSALAEEEVGTTTGGGYVTIDRVGLPESATISEGQRRKRFANLKCSFDECSYWLGPREGTAKAFEGDFNPFFVRQFDLVRGQSRRVGYVYEALNDAKVEPVETFSFIVRSYVRDAGGPWYDREDKTLVKILDATPRAATSVTALRQPLCYSC